VARRAFFDPRGHGTGLGKEHLKSVVGWSEFYEVIFINEDFNKVIKEHLKKSLGFMYNPEKKQKNIWVFPKNRDTPRWMVYNGKHY